MIPYRMNPMGIREKIPLTFTAQQAGSSVMITTYGTPGTVDLFYRRGRSGSWHTNAIGTLFTLESAGDSVQFWNRASTLSSGSSNYYYFVLSGQIAASGNLMSMLNYSDTVPASGFRKLFANSTANSALTSSPEMPAKSIGSLGCAGMFEKCTGMLSPIPEITAATLAENCFDSMYSQCSSMTAASVLKSPVMAQYCCQLMYYNCTSLESVDIPNVTLASYCFRRMFYGCSSLNLISTDMTSWSSTATQDWVDGVAASGTFTKPSALSESYGPNRIPDGWKVVNK